MRSPIKLLFINVFISFTGLYVILRHQFREAERVIQYEIFRGVAEISLDNRLFHPDCSDGDKLDQINDTLPVCHPGYTCHHDLNHSLPFPIDMKSRDLKYLERKFMDIQDGGAWAPCDCVSPSRIAIIIPFRDRAEHFMILLNNLIPFLQRQKKAFRIFLIEQGGDELFNRAAVSNAGFLEANKLGDFDCFIFHDVDLIPIDLCNVYMCGNQPQHLAVAMNKFRYKMPYRTYCGGVIAMRRDIVEKINGFTNVMFGWGGEDDDIYARIRRNNYNVTRYPLRVGRYNMIKHQRDENNPTSGRSMRDAGGHWKYAKYDGLNSANYTVESVELYQLFTRIVVRFEGGPKTKPEGAALFNITVQDFKGKLTRDAEEREIILNIIRRIRAEKVQARIENIKPILSGRKRKHKKPK